MQFLHDPLQPDTCKQCLHELDLCNWEFYATLVSCYLLVAAKAG